MKMCQNWNVIDQGSEMDMDLVMRIDWQSGGTVDWTTKQEQWEYKYWWTQIEQVMQKGTWIHQMPHVQKCKHGLCEDQDKGNPQIEKDSQ